jgi:CTD small phosphatase-like protein 2
MVWGKTIDIETENGDYRINLKIRPHAIEVLKRLKEKFEIGIFTASQEHYGSKILQELDPDNSIFSFKLFRQHCFEMHSRTGHVKDLRILKNRDLSKVILVDNSPHTYLFQKNNAIPIISFFNDL